MYFYFFGYGFVILSIIISLIAEINVKTTYSKYSKIESGNGVTGQSAARQILDYNGLQHVQIERVSGKLTDHYDPKANVIRLSEAVYDNSSVAAVGVAAHECGHAIQYAQNYTPVKIRSSIVGVTNICSRISFLLVIFGVLLMSAESLFGETIAFTGILAFSVVVLFQLVTLPVEFNASARALASIEEHGILESDEKSDAKKVLTAAALTYVAALLVSVLQLLRLVLMVTSNRRR